MIIEPQLLGHNKQNVKTIVGINLSDYISSGNFSQLDNDELLYFLEFFFQNFYPVKYNYEIYDTELLAIIRCLEQT